MWRLADACSCIRRLHPDLQHRVKPETLRSYEKHLEPFLAFLNSRWELSELSAQDIDLLIMEYRTELELSRSQHTLLLAALEFFNPHLKGKLQFTKEALKGRLQAEPVQHTTPLTYECAYLFAAFHASRGQPRLGVAPLVQLGTGLRPSELLGLCAHHVYVPINPRENISIRLGVDVATKVKREQFILVKPGGQPLTYRLLKLLKSATPETDKLFNFSYAAYNSSFSMAEQHYGLSLHLTAHSGRVGFATSRMMTGAAANEVQAEGRWRSETSFLTYVDVVGSLHTRNQLALGNLLSVADWCREHLDQYFVGLKIVDGPGQAKSCRQHESSGFAVERKQVPGPTTSRALYQPPKATVAQPAFGRAAGSNIQISHRDTNKTDPRYRGNKGSFAKGRGRGQLLPAGRPSQSIFD